MKLTKNDMARVIVTALYNRPALVAVDDPRVVAMARRKAVTLAGQHKLAIAVLEARLELVVADLEAAP